MSYFHSRKRSLALWKVCWSEMPHDRCLVVVAHSHQCGERTLFAKMCGGLNLGAHRDAVRELVREERISLVCLQEMKMHVISYYNILQILGPGFEYFFLPACQTRGGILVAWRSLSWVITNTSLRRFLVSLRVRPAYGGPEWWMSTVYGPMTEVNKQAILEELHSLSQECNRPWMLCGDFNMIYCTQDKNNYRLDCRRMGQFR
jgi:exonuclease III